MKKTYIIPATEVVEIKISQLIMTSQMGVLDVELESSEEILSIEYCLVRMRCLSRR